MAISKLHAKWNWHYPKQASVIPEEVRGLAVHKGTLKYTLLSASALALTALGDSFLYVYLPANYQSIGLSVFWVAVLLSINRFTRLILNSRVAYYLSKFDLRRVTIVTIMIATLTTLSYGYIESVFFWLVARVLWGLSFSTLRLSSTIFALEHHKQGFSLGLSKCITELGSVMALSLGPVLVLNFDRCTTFTLFAVLSAVGLPIVFFLPQLQTQPLIKKDLRLSFPSSLNVLVLLNTCVVEGMMVVLVGHLLLNETNIALSDILAMAGFSLAYRRLCLMIFSPLSGWLADIWGFRILFNYTSIFLALGIALVALGFTIPGLITSFTLSAMNTSVAPLAALKKGSSVLKDISDNATWRDIGAACGTLLGSLLLNFSYLHSVFMGVLVPIIAVLMVHFMSSKNKPIYNGIS